MHAVHAEGFCPGLKWLLIGWIHVCHVLIGHTELVKWLSYSFISCLDSLPRLLYVHTCLYIHVCEIGQKGSENDLFIWLHLHLLYNWWMQSGYFWQFGNAITHNCSSGPCMHDDVDDCNGECLLIKCPETLALAGELNQCLQVCCLLHLRTCKLHIFMHHIIYWQVFYFKEGPQKKKTNFRENGTELRLLNRSMDTVWC